MSTLPRNRESAAAVASIDVQSAEGADLRLARRPVPAAASVARSVAIRITVTCPALQDYIRRHPFLTGPDVRANRRALAALRSGTRVTLAPDVPPDGSCPAAATGLSQVQQQAADAMLRSAGMFSARSARAGAEWGWRVAAVPEDARSILCVMGSLGEELALLRARAPNARLVALDITAGTPAGPPQASRLSSATNAEVIAGRLADLLRAHESQFDVVFAGRLIEHLFDPDHLLHLLGRCLRPGGVLVLGLPLDGDRSTPLHGRLLRLGAQVRTLHMVDMGLFDAGHPWKTHAADLAATLRRAGFDDVRITRHTGTPSIEPGVRGPRAPSWVGKLSESAYAAVFGLARRLLRALLPAAPYWVCRGIVALERRTPFGASRLRNAGAPDVLARAVRRGLETGSG